MNGSSRQLRTHRRARLIAGLVILGLAAVVTSVVLSSAPSTPSQSLPAPHPGEVSSSIPEEVSSSIPEELPQSETVYELGLAPADPDTTLDEHLTTTRGINAQCDRLNDLLRAVCCERFEVGCNVAYGCDRLDIDDRDRMTGIANLYRYELEGNPVYAIHHQAVLDAIIRFFRTLQLYGRLERKLPVAYTRHPLQVDDQETKTRSNKIDRRDPAFLLLGSVLPGVSERGGTRMRLDYYASRDGLLLSVSPTSENSLAQAIAEYRANRFSFQEKQFTGYGARDLFDLTGDGAVPTISGCRALAIKEPAYSRAFWRPAS